jgi:predicted dehydrogenase
MTVRIGFIGAGGIARHHMEALSKIPAAKMVAFADIREEAAAEAARMYAGAAFGDWRKMLADVEMDAVYVCVPPDAHGDMEIEAARRGLQLFVEKPVNIDIGKATKIADAIDEAGVIAAAGYSLRYFPFYDQLKTVLKDLRVRQAVVTRWGSVPKAPWWRKMASSGGQLVEMVTHQIDLLRALIGEVVTVAAAYTYDRLEADGRRAFTLQRRHAA